MLLFRYLLSVILLLWLAIEANGQQSNTYKQILQEISNEKSAEKKMSLLIKIGDLYENVKPDSSLFFYEKCLNLADKEGDVYFQTKALRYIGIIHKAKGNTDLAMKYYNRSVEVAQNSDDKEVKLLEAGCYSNQGILYTNLGNPDSAIIQFNKGIDIYRRLLEQEKCDSNEFLNGTGDIYVNLGVLCSNTGNYSDAERNYRTAMGFYSRLKSSSEYDSVTLDNNICACLNNLGVIKYYLGVYDSSIYYYQKALVIQEGYGNEVNMASGYIGVGTIHEKLKNYEESIEYFQKALVILERMDYKQGIAQCINNIGGIYANLEQSEKALEYFIKAAAIREEIGEIAALSTTYSNIGAIYQQINNFSEAAIWYEKSIALFEKAGDNQGLAGSLGNLSKLFINLADSLPGKKKEYLKKSVETGLKSYRIASEIGALSTASFACGHLRSAYHRLGMHEEAYEYSTLFINLRDSLFNSEKTETIQEMEARYQSEKKQLEIEKLEKQKLLDSAIIMRQEADYQKQQIIILFFLAGFVIIIVFSIIIFRLFLQKKKANALLTLQNEEILHKNEEITSQRDEIEAQRDEIEAQRDEVHRQKEIVEMQKEEIEDSIVYAKRIQTAVLPASSDAAAMLGEHFIIFKPHSVVSGDFYWATETKEWNIITVADCTGHGVPGAFMSMLGISLLNEIVRKDEITTVGMVLNLLRKYIIASLRQTGEEGSAKDGMDMSILAIHKDKSQGMWAGANNPLYIVRNVISEDAGPFESGIDNPDTSETMELLEYKGDKMPVGVHERMDTFKDHKVEFRKGDKVYLFTDGFPDQFGGPLGKKYMYKPFKNLLLKTASFSIKEQKDRIEGELSDWMNNYSEVYDQVDDITVVGIKV